MKKAKYGWSRMAQIGAIACLSFWLIQCGADSGVDELPGPVFLVIDDIVPQNPADAPFGDVFDNTPETFGSVFPDTLNIRFRNVPKNQQDFVISEYNDIIIERYVLTWTRTDGGLDHPDNLDQAVNIRVPANGFTTFSGILATRAVQKFQFPIFYLRPDFGGIEPSTGFFSINARGDMTFYGHILSGEPIQASGSFSIEWTNFADE